VKKIIQKGACSALIKNPGLAREIYEATVEGAGGLPVSVKTRIGFSRVQTEEWIGFLLEKLRPAVLTIHGRTVKDMSKVPNRWEEIGKSVRMAKEMYADKPEQQPLMIGNGDITSLSQAQELARQYELDGVMVGKGMFTNPWFFNSEYESDEQGQVYYQGRLITAEDRLRLMWRHLEMWEQEWELSEEQQAQVGKKYAKNFALLKKFFKIYISNFAGAGELRQKAMEVKDVGQAKEVIRSFLEEGGV
jgi:tRNA-dihydrouridine synthase